MAKIAKTSSKKLGKRPRADKHKGKKQNQQALDRSGDGTLRQGAGKRARKSQPWKRKQTNKAGESADELLQDVRPEHADEAAPTLVQKSRDEIISKTLAEKIRKRDEETEDMEAGKVPRKALVEIKDARLMSRILYCNPVCFLTTVVPRAVRVKTSAVKGNAEEVAEGEHAENAKEETAESEVPAGSGEGDAGDDASGGGRGLVQLAEGGSNRNVMVLSWLTPTNNEGGFVCALHKRRFSAECLQARGHFALSIPVAGMEGMVLKVGDVTGKTVDKFNLIDGLEFVELGSCARASRARSEESAGKKRAVDAAGAKSANPFAALEGDDKGDDGAAAPLSARELQERALAGDEAGEEEEEEEGVYSSPISGCVAQAECRVVRVQDADDGKHHLVSAQILRAWVHPDYWNEKHFTPTRPALPALLSFLGSSRFAHIR